MEARSYGFIKMAFTRSYLPRHYILPGRLLSNFKENVYFVPKFVRDAKTRATSSIGWGIFVGDQNLVIKKRKKFSNVLSDLLTDFYS